jgi:hypothetical protein
MANLVGRSGEAPALTHPLTGNGYPGKARTDRGERRGLWVYWQSAAFLAIGCGCRARLECSAQDPDGAPGRSA